MSSSVSATNSPSFSSNDPGQIARRIAFSSMHSIADSRSFTAYRAPECNSPWWRPVVPEVNSPRSTSVTRMPRNVRSWASAPPVPPPPRIRTCGASRDARGADRVIDASIAPRASRDVLRLLMFALSFGERAFMLLLLVLLGLLTLGEVALFSSLRFVVFLLLAFRVGTRLAIVGLLLLTLGEVAVVVFLLRHGVLLGRERRNGGHLSSAPDRGGHHVGEGTPPRRLRRGSGGGARRSPDGFLRGRPGAGTPRTEGRRRGRLRRGSGDRAGRAAEA